MYKEVVIAVFVLGFVFLSVQAVGDGCKDHHPKCIRWAAKGECSKNPQWMLKHCRSSCGQCAQANIHELLSHADYEMMGGVKIILVIFGFLILGIILKLKFYGASCESKAKLNGKTIIITGSNTGIGKETARDLAWRKAHVILACRDTTKALKAAAEIIESTGNENVEVKKLDLASFKSIRKFAEEVLAEEVRIDVLINNAGYFGPHIKTSDGLDTTFQANYLGHFLLTHLLLDKIKACSPSRIINVSSIQHFKGSIDFDNLQGEKSYGLFSAYNRSKLAQVMFTRQLAEKLKGTKVTVNALHPGVVSTDITRNFRLLQMWILRPILAVVSYFFFKTPMQGAQTTIHCAVAPELEEVTGCYFDDCAECPCAEKAKDDGVAKKLWELSERLCGLTNDS